jgi:hemoglobin-like flavoprotein
VRAHAWLQFYKRLSERSPAFAEYFGDDTRKKGTILVRMTEFMAAVDYDQLEKYQNRLRMVGKSHVGQGIKPWMYAVFVETLVQTICHCLGLDMTEEVHDAWLNLAAFALRGMLPEVIKDSQELEEAGMTLSGKSQSQASDHSQSDRSRVMSASAEEGKTEV